MSQLESLRLFYEELLLPLEVPLAHWPEPEEERELSPLWHLGHMAEEVARVLVSPFDKESNLPHQFSGKFQGSLAQDAWRGPWPEFDEIKAWWETLFMGLASLEELHQTNPAIDPAIDLGGHPLASAQEAWDYALFHTGFHLGRVHQLVGW
ncbi:MAG: hypothetical protein A2508_05595 [Candidatus Lambdaproteobacteria bacterium RIFOXYD12_FULL_49_8]|uniref:DinB-like domain-containing protein n=1 Tax=Candidatus Lambdaproteobacteria bacterium RIFOXYD2_FULL_50_16 TaxID=1817772 RepID=A0A1F6G7D8_9PROT|nr:MAG: hypothetical protein A2527_09200 [Candidatus Lambdaproteobacteria bacterium RIFOXYD2_FULL_50_16]OGG98393.1 MAG: hypothetical protein A2508_05595 [Candidatus Lambdaproteobacteria bacterium RIFOXYD12_FULL_49_8]